MSVLVLSGSGQNFRPIQESERQGSSDVPFSIRSSRALHHSIQEPSLLEQPLEGRFGEHPTLRIFSADSLPPRVAWKPFNSTTIAVQAISGIGLAVAISIPIVNMAKKGGDFSDLGAVIIGAPLAFAVLPVAIFWVGELSGGDGSYGWTVVGTLVGGGVGLLPRIISGYGGAEQHFPIATLVGVAGGIIAYHLFASPVSGSVAINDRNESHAVVSFQARCLPPSFSDVRITLASVTL